MTAYIFKLGAGTVFSAFLLIPVYGQSDSAAIASIAKHRAEQFEAFTSEKSPLDKKARKRFKGLKYYPVDLSYRVEARFVKTENPVLFKMKTTTSRLPDYVKYGEVHFRLKEKDYMLEVYQSPEIMKRPGYEDYLFIPFIDLTNGDETYDIGRYLEFRIPSDEKIVLDFNVCYNPYCSYSPNYSCPIPPEVNHLPLAVRAGEKKFKE